MTDGEHIRYGIRDAGQHIGNGLCGLGVCILLSVIVICLAFA